MDTSKFTASAFNLYQKGLAPDQVLQLCYLRRPVSRRLRLEETNIENDFVLPRPEMKITNLLPPANLSVNRLVDHESAVDQTFTKAKAAPLSRNSINEVRESAKRHFLQPWQAVAGEISQWFALAESDWIQLHRSLTCNQDDEMTANEVAAAVPDITAVCWVLERCPSDAFVSFVWNHLLIKLHSLKTLAPKDFRAKVRARNLRQVDEALGAQLELNLITMYRRQRDAAK